MGCCNSKCSRKSKRVPMARPVNINGSSSRRWQSASGSTVPVRSENGKPAVTCHVSSTHNSTQSWPRRGPEANTNSVTSSVWWEGWVPWSSEGGSTSSTPPPSVKGFQGAYARSLSYTSTTPTHYSYDMRSTYTQPAGRRRQTYGNPHRRTA